MTHKLKILAAAASVLALTACSGAYVQSIPSTTQRIGNGYYALPRMYVSFTVTYGPKQADSGDTGDGGGTDAATDPDKPAKPAKPDKKAAKVATAAKPVKKTKKAKAGGKPETVDTSDWIVTVSDPKTVYAPDPDPAYHYTIHLKHSDFADDHLKVETDENGLLKAINADNDDKTATVVGKAIELGIDVAKLAVAYGRTGVSNYELIVKSNVPPVACPKPNKPFSLSIVFDPTDPKQIAETKKALCEHGIEFGAFRLAAVVPEPSTPAPVAKPTTGKPTTGKKDSVPEDSLVDLSDPNAEIPDNGVPTTADGMPIIPGMRPDGALDCGKAICFRPAMPYYFKVDTHSYMVVAPDPGSVLGIAFDRVPLTDAPVAATFINGMLTSVDTTKHSSVVAGLQIPIDAVNAIAAIPSELLTIKVKHIEDQKGLLDQESALLKAQAQLIADYKALEDARNAAAPAATGH